MTIGCWKGSILLVLMGIVMASTLALDISAYLEDRRFVAKQISCALNQGPCDYYGRKFKNLLPEALRHNCGNCWSWQSSIMEQVVPFMQLNYPDEWRAIIRMYNPRDEF